MSDPLTLEDLQKMAADIQDRMEGVAGPWTLDIHVPRTGGLREWGAVTFECCPPDRFRMGLLGAARAVLPSSRMVRQYETSRWRHASYHISDDWTLDVTRELQNPVFPVEDS